MKIALFHNLPSGGAKRTIYEQVKRLAAHHTIDLYSLTCADQSFCDITPYITRSIISPFTELRKLKSPFGRLNQALRILDILRIKNIQHSLADEINKGEYDIALVHPCMFIPSPSILRYLNIPSLYFRHDVVRNIQDPYISRPYNKKNKIRNTLDKFDPFLIAYINILAYEDRLNMLDATRVITNSYFVRESLYRIYNVAPFVCYHGVDTDQFYPVGGKREDYVVSVGMLTPAKGFDFLIESLSYISLQQRPRLVIISNSRIEQEAFYLEALARKLQVMVEFKTMIETDELVKIYNHAKCTVYTPIMESFGLVPLESMACGTPVVAICEGGVRETVIPEVSGFLADREPKQFAEKVLSLITNQTLMETLGCKSREYVLQNWDWDSAIYRLETQMRNTVNDYGRDHNGK